jgi:hypothetical protein
LRLASAAVAAVFTAWALLVPSPPPTIEGVLRRALLSGTGVVELPAGVIELSVQLFVGPGAHDLDVRGAASGTTLRAAAHFHGRAVILCDSASRIRFSGFTIDGNRTALEQPSPLPPANRSFAEFTTGNGILAVHVTDLSVSRVRFTGVAGLAILASRSRDVLVDRVKVEDSGSRNGIWTHSLYTSPRSRNGRIAGNHLERIGRDAIQVGHATLVRVENNTGRFIGFPADMVDVAGGPVAIDTAGNTDCSTYQDNRFEEVNGKCIDLDGFHDGTVRANVCVNRGASEYPHGHYGIVMNNSNPDMQSQGVRIVGNEIDGALFGGIFVIGSGNLISQNRLRRLNLARCPQNTRVCKYAADQPDLLRRGIYLGAGAERPTPARDNVVEGNEISGFGMSAHCIVAAPGVSIAANDITRNSCKDNGAQ